MYILIKRGTDFLLALILCLVLLLPILIIGLIVFFDGRPVVFAQKRLGYKERTFKIYKFRSMKFSAYEGEMYVTKIGKRLRQFGLDELPQLYNILKGDMSFIGPRPLLPEYLPLYRGEERKRHNQRPGLTGLAQVMGGNSLSWEEKFTFDLEYIEKIGPLMDLRIFYRTILIMIKRFKTEEKDYEPIEPFNCREE